MELIVSIISFLKAVFPATVGSIIAVYRKRDDIDFKQLNAFDKFLTVLVAIGAIIVGICIGVWVGNAIVSYKELPFFFTPVIQFVTALSGLKLVDSVMKSVEAALDVVAKNVPPIIESIMKGIADKVSQFFGKK